MNLKVRKSQIFGRVAAPSSKSVAHRMIIACALSGLKKETTANNDDVVATNRCLNVMLETINDKQFAPADKYVVLNAGESGSTLRFLLPIACALGARVEFVGEGRLAQRPIKQLVDVLTAHGARIRYGNNVALGDSLPLFVDGKLQSGEYRLKANVSSQYITGLLFALPLLDGDSHIVLDGKVVSKSYINITLQVLSRFGIVVTAENNGYYIKGGQQYIAPCNVVNADKLLIEGDWSSAGFLLALGTLCGYMEVSNLNAVSAQGDRVVVDLLRKAGADIKLDSTVAVAKKSSLSAIEFDAEDCPDAVPVMSIVLACADGTSKIHSVDRLRQKESDRLYAVRTMLASFGIVTDYSNDTLVIYGGRLKGGKLNGFCDHRIAMSSIVGAMCAEGDSIVEGVECIKKSYPDFIKDVQSAGGQCEFV